VLLQETILGLLDVVAVNKAAPPPLPPPPPQAVSNVKIPIVISRNMN
jgi:hypothetical protein